jgi:hypothetical protein
MQGNRPYPNAPMVVAYGLGVDSTAMLIEFARRGIRPDLILFADTGGEKPETYAYLPVIQRFLTGVGFPDVITVRYQPKWATYKTLEDQCLHTGTLPSLAYGGKSCAVKYKKVPQDKYVAGWGPALRCWARGGKVLKAIGFDAGPADSRRHRFVEDERHKRRFTCQSRLHHVPGGPLRFHDGGNCWVQPAKNRVGRHGHQPLHLEPDCHVR